MRAMTEYCFLSVCTLLLYFLRPWSTAISRSGAWQPVAALGAISYSLYLVHQFNLHLTHSLAQHLTPSNSPQIVTASLQTLLLVAIAALFWYACERPFMRRPASAPAVVAERLSAKPQPS
jgi:peptidoglycan/LPS O-acetylase OafA/YrhL